MDGLIAPLKNALIVNAADNVAVALRDIAEGEPIDAAADLRAKAPIAKGHKVALARLAAGDAVTKYGAPIGRATAAIEPGEHVHTHNLQSALAAEETYGIEPSARETHA